MGVLQRGGDHEVTISPYISLYLTISPYISLYLPISPSTLTSPRVSLRASSSRASADLSLSRASLAVAEVSVASPPTW